jgi:hypothetical protein
MMMQTRCSVKMLLILAVITMSSVPAYSQTREEKVRADRKKVEQEGFWIYNNLPEAFRQAKQTGKPILVVLRCIPCEECVKLDDELVDTDPVIRPLLEQFVCARQVSTNGLDLSLFQYDTDQSFAAFMLNADRTIYARFGTRSHRTEWYGDVSLPGLAKALQAALDLHAGYPGNKQMLAGKSGQPMEVASPEKYPSLNDKFTDRLNYDGEVVKSCIHCHQIGDAQREFYWHANQPIPEKVLFPYPHPKSLGLIIDPKELATVQEVKEDSIAQKAGLRAGDRIQLFNGQPMLSIADVQWVLHNIDPDGAIVPLKVERRDQVLDLNLQLPSGWRRLGDIEWRVTSWGLRRMVTGGLKLRQLPQDQRSRLNLSDNQMALQVEHVGQYGAHAAAKNAGAQKDDIIVAYDGRTDLTTPTALLSYGVTHRKPGDRVQVKVLRNGSTKTLTLPIQK